MTTTFPDNCKILGGRKRTEVRKSDVNKRRRKKTNKNLKKGEGWKNR